MKLLKFIHTVNETEPEMARREYITRNVLFFLFIVAFSFTLISFILYLCGKMPLDTLIIYSIISIMLLVAMFLTAKGYWRAVGFIPPLLMYFAAVNGNYIGGIDAPGNFLYALLIMFVAIIYGYRKMWIALFICLATYLCLAWMISSGYIKPFRTAEVVFINRVVIISGSLVIISLMIWILGRSYRNEIDASIKAEELLDGKNDELRTLNETLRASETKYKFLAESMADVVFTLDINLATTYVSPSMERMLGFTQEERIAQKVDQQLTAKSQKLVFETLMGELDREKDKSTDPDRSVAMELEYYHKDGSIKYLATYIRAIRDSEGNLTGFYGSHHDITARKEAEESLKDSEDRYRTLVENASDIIFRTDNTGHFTFVNPAAISITGYKKEEVIGMHYPTLIRLDMRDEAIKFFGLQFVKRLNNTYSEYPIIAKDGHELWLGQNTQLLVENGNVIGFQSVARDITDRKRAEEALHDAEDTYRNIFMNAQIGLYRTDLKTGIMIECNDKLAQAIGYKNREELLSSNFNIAERYVDTEARKEVFALIKEHGQINNYETPFRINDGGIRWVRFSAKLVPAKSWLEGVSEDITKEKNSRELLQISEERYRSLVENANEVILVIQEGMIKFLNNLAIETFGYSEQELLSINIFELVHPEDRALVMERYLQKINGDNTSTKYTYRTIHKSGQTQWIEISSVLIDWEGNPATLNLINNITERKQAEQQLKETLESLRKSVGTTIQVMVAAVETRDPYTAGHQVRSANLARTIATEMGLSQDKIEGIRMAGSIHDIGKLSIPAEILTKPTKLLEIEFALIKEHSLKGYEILKDVESSWPLAEIVYQHHERMDGSGYPRKLKGNDILMEARILIVSDVVEAMASHRPYRPALGIDAALEELEKHRGTLYDEAVVDACLRLFREKGFKLELT